MRYKFFSIIIPHHNIPKLLKRLLNSIPKRDDVEIIVVDDKSDQEFISELYGLEKEYCDAKFVFCDECKGGGAARNVGLQYASGEWILFADADDFFNYCINDALDDYKNSDADVVYFNANSLDCDLYTAINRVGHLNDFIDEYVCSRKDLNLRYKFGEPWCKMVRRRLIIDNNIRFEETSIHNDTAYSYLVGFFAKKILVDRRAIYCVTGRENSVSKGVSFEKKLERVGVFSRSSKFFKSHDIPVTETRHFKQLFELMFENKRFYIQAIDMMNQCGYTSVEIRVGLLKQFVVYLISIPKQWVKHILQRMLGKHYC